MGQTTLQPNLMPSLVFTAMAVVVIVNWLLLAMAFRRARQAGGGSELAFLAIMPVVQIPIILWLCIAPPAKAAPAEPPPGIDPQRWSARRSTALGLVAGSAITLVAAAFSTLVLGVYGYALFLGTPFIIGVVTAYLANRGQRRQLSETFGIVSTALVFGSFALIGFAVEGAICLILATPLIFAMAFVGTLLGRAIAQARSQGSAMLRCVALLPVLLLMETTAPPQAEFESVESIDVAAGPDAVWDSIIHMGPIPDAPAAPFRWGLAYPVAGEITGAGVGAVRRGLFSTGEAFERVTEWEPSRKLTFIVLSDPPMMHELSPYEHIAAAHVRGYFRTEDARFSITPLGNGQTRLTLATHHHLDIEPALYWIPIAQWAVHENKRRVLAHFASQAEGGSR